MGRANNLLEVHLILENNEKLYAVMRNPVAAAEKKAKELAPHIKEYGTQAYNTVKHGAQQAYQHTKPLVQQGVQHATTAAQHVTNLAQSHPVAAGAVAAGLGAALLLKRHRQRKLQKSMASSGGTGVT